MISIKGGTKVWSDAPQQVDHKNKDQAQVSTVEKSQFFNDQEVGDVLNKISDPNWVDPTKKARQVGNNQLDKDAFLNLLLTQMKHQDPTNPLKSHEMAAQLAQFTSLEKLSSIDDGIEKLALAQEPSTRFEALNFIGKTVSVDGSRVTRAQAEGGHDISFAIPQDAQKVDLVIKDVEGEVVRELSFPTLKAGKNEVYWNGNLEDGTAAPIGEYSVEIAAIGSNGAKLHAQTKVEGKITGINYTAQGPVLLAGKQQIAMKDVTKIIDESLVEPSQAIMPTQALPKEGEQKPVVDQSKNTSVKATHAQGNIKDLGLSQGLINKLEKEGIEAGM